MLEHGKHGIVLKTDTSFIIKKALNNNNGIIMLSIEAVCVKPSDPWSIQNTFNQPQIADWCPDRTVFGPAAYILL